MQPVHTKASDPSHPDAHAFERSLASDVVEKRIPGAVVAKFQRANQVINAIGFRDSELCLPMREDSVFRIHSLTKPIVSLGILMLMEEGMLSLDDKLSKFIPIFSRLRVEGQPDARPEPTIRHLLTHTAGFTYEFLGTGSVHKQYMDANLVFGEMTNEEFCNRISEIPLLFEPGTKWHYSHATDILGRVIEEVTGKSLGNYLSKKIFSPLGMSDTGFLVADKNLPRVAHPFPNAPKINGRIDLADPRRPTIQEMGGHGLYSTAPDYLKFLEVMARKGRFENSQLVAESTMELMFSSQVQNIPPISSAMKPQDNFGIGVALSKRNDANIAYWFGWAGTYCSIDTDSQKAFLFLVQQPATRDHYISQFLDSLSLDGE